MLSLDSLINIIVNLPSQTTRTEDFSLGLLLSENTVIATADRIKSFESVDAVIAGGFDADSPEAKAAALYFGQTPKPTRLLIGVQGTEETAVQALTACRNANTQWYLCIPVGYAKADLVLLAAYVESATPATTMFCTTSDADVLAGTAGNLCLSLQASKYRRTLVQYSTYANAAASIAGYVCGMNDGNTSFDLSFKTEPGVTVEDLDSTDASILDNENCNYYASYQNTFNIFRLGNMSDGTAFDEVLGLDMLVADMQSAAMSTYMSLPKVPLTDSGVSMMTNAIVDSLNHALTRGFIAGGIWHGDQVLSLNTGDSLPNGYSIQAGSVDDLSATERQKRKSPPIYVCIVLANSVRSVVVNVNVNR